jgi:dipeptidyl aminopeptidase/acylaminoacyl peptidase
VAILGGSYGGYAVLAALTFTPEAFQCGVDLFGPANLETLLASTLPYWAWLRPIFARRIGDPDTDEGRALLRERSPVHEASAIVRPLLIAQGANDPRVKQAESDQIVQAMTKAGIPVTYVLFSDEGHGFVRPPNNIAFTAVAEAFLSDCLGGRYQPIGGDFAGSTIKITGGEHISGVLPAAAVTGAR